MVGLLTIYYGAYNKNNKLHLISIYDKWNCIFSINCKKLLSKLHIWSNILYNEFLIIKKKDLYVECIYSFNILLPFRRQCAAVRTYRLEIIMELLNNSETKKYIKQIFPWILSILCLLVNDRATTDKIFIFYEYLNHVWYYQSILFLLEIKWK